MGKSVVNERVLRSVWSFFFLYVMITKVFRLDAEPDGVRSVYLIYGAVAAYINNMGLGFGKRHRRSAR